MKRYTVIHKMSESIDSVVPKETRRGFVKHYQGRVFNEILIQCNLCEKGDPGILYLLWMLPSLRLSQRNCYLAGRYADRVSLCS
jgi:hypothetical protein